MFQGPRSSIIRSIRAGNLGKIIRDEAIRFLSLQFADLAGVLKSVTVPADQADELLASGIWFDGSSMEGFAQVSESDMLLVPDLDTFAVVPWSAAERRMARLICDVYTPESCFQAFRDRCSSERWKRPPRWASPIESGRRSNSIFLRPMKRACRYQTVP
ncbi:MAG: glutamine synthetase [Chloroflexi bacterium]|nr:glutamine synthetase [Chloroflexota bacterium]